jgi:hypothetical protein
MIDCLPCPDKYASVSVVSTQQRAHRNSWIDPGDFGALYADTRHQSFLAENERIDVLLGGCGGQ